MNIDEAKQLVRNVLGKPYNEDSFRGLIRSIFEDYQSLDENAYSGAYIWEAFREHIVSYKRIAKYEHNGKLIDVLAVCVKNENKLEYARTMQRNFVSKYLNGGRGNQEKDAAIVAFYSQGNDDWRLSLVKMDYNYDEDKQKITKDFTPARRFSFLVGANEQVHTACKQFLPVLTGGGNPSLADLEAIFNIETVSDEFFEKYKELFLRLAEAIDDIRQKDSGIDNDFILNHITTQLFCQKLLGQIVFLYFLQKKGWMGVEKGQSWGTGDKRFLRSLFQKATNAGKNYFNDYLEHLFYEALAIKRPDSYFELLGCRIPFLNGGLFEPLQGYDWEKYDIVIPNEIFSNKNVTSEGDIGDGILDVFDRYNFTVREDEALEKEVAVDPEMLGKVFENLLDIKDRKSKGAFYTPREIVHYMCQESLIQYLYNKVNGFTSDDNSTELISKQDISDFIRYGDMLRENEKQADSSDSKTYTSKLSANIKKYAKEIDDALENVLVCDPAIGSGAFPVGIMNEIVRARLSLLEYGYIKDKRARNAYVYKRHAIQKSIYGTDIDSGAVEIAKLRFWLSLVVDEESLDDIKPLPNLDYKIMEANSLLKITGSLFNHALLRELADLKSNFGDETDPSKKRTLKNKIDKILAEFSRGKGFDFEIFFSEVFSANKGFDIVIGNPPYVQLQKFKNEKVPSGDFAGQTYQDLYKAQNFKTYEATGDLYCLFYEKGLSLLRPRGVLCYITSNKWMRASYGESLRDFFAHHNPLLLIDLGSNVFSTATVDTNILLVEKKGYDRKTLSCIMKDRTQDMSVFVRHHATYMYFDKDAWVILDPIEQSIRAKIEKYGTPLRDWDIAINYGIKTGCNEAFIIDGAKRAELIAADPKSDEIIRPILRGKDIKRYGYDFDDKWLINIECGFTNSNRGNMKPEEFIKSTYPAVYQHFTDVANRPTKGKGLVDRDDKGDYWWELRSCAYMNDFAKQKIMYSEIVRSPRFFLDNEGKFYPEATSFIMVGNHLEYLVMALHSKILTYAFKTFYAGGGLGDDGYRYKKAFLEKLPIYVPTDADSIFKNWLESNNDAKIENYLQKAYKLTDYELDFIYEQKIFYE